MATKDIFYQWVDEACIVQSRFVLVHRDIMRRRALFVIFPMHYLLLAFYYLEHQWQSYRFKQSYIDKLVGDSIELSYQNDAANFVRNYTRKCNDN